MTPPEAGKQPYHHGDLRRALVQAGTELAREGGPSAIVLREAARRVGVSPNAAYRHFDALPELVEAVAFEGLAGLARSMEAELAKCQPTGDAGVDAVERLRAVGRGYVQFAINEPGLFGTAFSAHHTTADSEEALRHAAGRLEDDPRGVGDSGLGPGELLEQALDGMLAAGVLDAEDRETAAFNAWSVVHGLSGLLLGPLAEEAGSTRDELIDRVLELV
ncbi:MAG TPA: TetR/AcrR family transcriptional regulator, partial [Jatrophihabitantaceae bacterium]|nr:TetR/AcrR family transcriptional regulator [Jatrophihabitantaceae bacterium]